VSWTDKWIEHTVEDISTLKQQLPSRERVFTPTNINRAIVLGAIGVMIITAKVGLTHVGQELSPGINHFKRDLANPTWQKDQYVKFFLSVGGGVFSSILSNRNKVKKASIAEYAGDFAKYFLATDILLTIGHKNLYDLSSLNGAVGGLALIMESFKATRDRTDFKRRRDHALSSVFEVGVDSYTTLQFPPYILVLLAGLGITILREGARDTFTIHKG
ncbi:hypothetical protein KC660_02080, partial [Candidatus Dojkabacteria bacterium]|nr:hypothetical protein [Candidatus Dojkabacteria bacterium]